MWLFSLFFEFIIEVLCCFSCPINRIYLMALRKSTSQVNLVVELSRMMFSPMCDCIFSVMFRNL